MYTGFYSLHYAVFDRRFEGIYCKVCRMHTIQDSTACIYIRFFLAKVDSISESFSGL